MKLLIISSEPLYPGFTLGSTFELTQAQILRDFAEVAIISVSPQLSALALLKNLLRGKKSNENFFSIGANLLFGKRKVNKYQIDGVTVYEGTNCAFFSAGNFEKKLSQWLKAGWAAFRSYSAEQANPALVHAHGRFLNAGALAEQVFRQEGIPYVYTEHSTFFQRGIAPQESKWILQKVIRHASAYTVVSSTLLKSVEKFLGERFPQALVMPNALDQLFEEELIVQEQKKDRLQLICVASLEEKKGIDILIKAYQKTFSHNKPILKICGDGPMRETLEQQIDKARLNDCIFLIGKKSKTEVRDLMDHSDFFVLPSIVETFGVVVIEALSRGCPVLATNSGGPEFLLNRGNGILTKAGDAEALSKGMSEMVKKIGDFNRQAIRRDVLKKYGSVAFRQNSQILYDKALQWSA